MNIVEKVIELMDRDKIQMHKAVKQLGTTIYFMKKVLKTLPEDTQNEYRRVCKHSHKLHRDKLRQRN